MSTPTAPGGLPPIIHPSNVPVLYADRVVLQTIDGITHFLFCSARPKGVAPNGEVLSELVVIQHVTVTNATANQTADIIKNVQTAQAVQQLQQKKKLN